jgi:hypothetical protein
MVIPSRPPYQKATKILLDYSWIRKQILIRKVAGMAMPSRPPYYEATKRLSDCS